MNINEKIRALRKSLHLTQDQFAQKLNIKRSLVGAYEEGRAEPRLELLQKMASLAHLSLDDLMTGNLGTDLTMKPSTARGTDVVVVTIDTQQRNNIELVPQKAAAGYLNGYADPEFVKELPRFSLPLLKQGTYRAFEITGDSMLPILPGTIVIGEFVEDLRTLRNGRTYVLVTQRDGIVYKRVFNYIDENGKIFLVSDNRQYAPYQMDAADVIEAWAAKAYISVQFPDVESKTEVSTEQLASLLLDMQKEILQLKNEKRKKN
jgi:transcriptional regulator with XRE-family HTH domain